MTSYSSYWRFVAVEKREVMVVLQVPPFGSNCYRYLHLFLHSTVNPFSFIFGVPFYLVWGSWKNSIVVSLRLSNVDEISEKVAGRVGLKSHTEESFFSFMSFLQATVMMI